METKTKICDICMRECKELFEYEDEEGKELVCSECKTDLEKTIEY